MPHTSLSVIGAGHAGIEAALAAARLGVDTTLFTLSLDALANMPCNPSIGGTAKGHLVYEIDALGGEMGRAADRVTMQSRTLNLGKGAAVHSKRVQADRMRYHAVMKETVEKTPNLRLVQAEITDIVESHDEKGNPTGVLALRTSLGETWETNAVVIATGTYPDAKVFVGDSVIASGPDASLPARGLSDALRRMGVPLLRFKTGTPARIHRASVDFDRLECQPGEDAPTPFSADTDPADYLPGPQYPCYVVYTNITTHTIIKDNIHRSALFSGHISGTGPRYCPSIEDKVTRFADKDRHQLFLEPMGEDTEEMYLQGFSTSLPVDVQREMIHSLPGFEHAEIMRYAYAIEYDCIDPTALDATLAFKNHPGLFGAGQFNGTSGYEEAAAQGLLAGINAALYVLGRPMITLPRSGSYIGTLVDDLVTKGTREPYRMMTSRSEFRLLLRQDNADLRLTPLGREIGLISDDRYNRFLDKKAFIDKEKSRLETTYVSPEKANALLAVLAAEEAKEPGENAQSALGAPLKSGASLADLLRRPGLTYDALAPIDPDRPSLPRAVIKTVETDLKYAGYIKRELAEAERQKKLAARHLPVPMDYTKIRGLRIEAAQKLTERQPTTLAQAQSISGVSPADITVLLLHFGLK